MIHYRQTNSLSPTDAAYIAGFVDGDGTVTLTRKHRNENRRAALSISNTDRRLLEFTLETVGAGRITSKHASSNKHTPCFTYGIENRQALSLLAQLEPYLRSYKKDRAQFILRHYLSVTPRNGKYSEDLLESRKRFERDLLAILPYKNG